MKNTRNTKAVSLFLSVSLILSAAVLYYSMRTEKYERYITHLSDRAFSENEKVSIIGTEENINKILK